MKTVLQEVETCPLNTQFFIDTNLDHIFMNHLCYLIKSVMSDTRKGSSQLRRRTWRMFTTPILSSLSGIIYLIIIAIISPDTNTYILFRNVYFYESKR